MRLFTILGLLCSVIIADILNINSFEADFVQHVSDDKEQVISYKGKVQALAPHYALWRYENPVDKSVYIQKKRVTIVEPELEQVIIRKIVQDFNIFTLIKNAQKISENSYLAKLDETEIFIEFSDSKLASLSYKDKFDNDVKVLFSNQHQNITIPTEIFNPTYPLEYDIISE